MSFLKIFKFLFRPLKIYTSLYAKSLKFLDLSYLRYDIEFVEKDFEIIYRKSNQVNDQQIQKVSEKKFAEKNVDMQLINIKKKQKY